MNSRVFISYRHKDSDVVERFVTVLESLRIECGIDQQELMADEGFDERIAQAITASEALLLLITPASEENPKQQKREVLIAEKYGIPILPVFLVDPSHSEKFDYFVRSIPYIDASKGDGLEGLKESGNEIRHMLASLRMQRWEREGKDAAVEEEKSSAPPAVTPPPPPPPPLAQYAENRCSVVILYRHHVESDEALLFQIRDFLTGRGHQIFFDKDLKVGEEWRQAIREKVEYADVVIPLLSVFSIGSEMLEEELLIARRTYDTNGKKPRILPVRVGYEGPLLGTLSRSLEGLQYLLWKGEEETLGMCQRLADSIENPPALPATVDRESEPPTGAVPLSSPFYVVRHVDQLFQAGVDRGDSIVLVKGARQMGKTSLISRVLRSAREGGSLHTAVTDLQTLNESDLATMENFYRAAADSIADQLDLDIFIDETWKEAKAPNFNFERYIRKTVLESLGEGERFLWAIDEGDRLFPRPFGTEVFGLFRSWHNQRQLNPHKGWERMTLVIGYATEAALFISDVNMSPFNVGTQVTLGDFSREEVADLNSRYGSPIAAAGIPRLMEKVGGQPFLIRRSLYALAVEGKDFEELLASADDEGGIFGDHLRRFYISLHKDEELEQAVRAFILQGEVLEPEAFHRLRSAGLVNGDSRHDASVRCGIYRAFLQKHLS